MKLHKVIFVFSFILAIQQASSQDKVYFNNLSRQLESIREEDIQSRKRVDSLQRIDPYNTPLINAFWDSIRVLDAKHSAFVAGILDKHGWLDSTYISAKASHTLFLVIQHADVAIQERYLPSLRKAVKSNRYGKVYYAMLTDRILMKKNKFQLYGTQIGSIYTGQQAIWPIRDARNVNKRRKELGLQSIEEYAKKNQVILQMTLFDSLENRVLFEGFITPRNNRVDSATAVFITDERGVPLATVNTVGYFRLLLKRSDLKKKRFIKSNQCKGSLPSLKSTQKDRYFLNLIYDESCHVTEQL